MAKISAAVRLARLGLSDGPGGSGGAARRRPLLSMLLHGPTGVGKSLLCRGLGQLVFGSSRHVLRLDMGEYAQSNSVAKLIGAPPG